MKGDAKVIEYLNAALRSELTAVSQYWLHYRLQEDWGFGRIAKKSREEYIELIALLREAMPDIALSTDMIVGFPGETAADFEETLSLTAAARYHSMFSFKYSPRPNTLALKRMADDVSEDEKTRRIMELQALQKAIQGELFAAAIGRIEAVLVDATSRRREWELSGRTSGNTVVNFPGEPSWVGRIVDVRINGANPNSLRGEAA